MKKEAQEIEREESQNEEPNVLDLSSQPENLNILAGHIAEIMTNPATPEKIFNCLSDELSDAAEGVTYSPEKIVGILESKGSRE